MRAIIASAILAAGVFGLAGAASAVPAASGLTKPGVEQSIKTEVRHRSWHRGHRGYRGRHYRRCRYIGPIKVCKSRW